MKNIFFWFIFFSKYHRFCFRSQFNRICVDFCACFWCTWNDRLRLKNYWYDAKREERW